MPGRNIVITDIHGCAHTFEALLDQLAYGKTDHLFLLGDYIDRGPNSKGVLDLLFFLKKNQYQLTMLRGNHEQIFLDALQSPSASATWDRGIGATALPSFGVTTIRSISAEYIELLESTTHFAQIPGFLLVHAGFNFNLADPLSDQTAMLWIRGWRDAIRPDWLGDRVIFHGHTPVPIQTIEAQFAGIGLPPSVNLDNGCALKSLGNGFGNLCAFDLTNQRLYLEPNRD